MCSCLLSMVLLVSLAHFTITANGTKIINPSIYKYDMEVIRNRPINRQIHPFILSRRSIRSMNGKAIRQDELMSLFEAARWAPSAFNTQGWRFIYAERNSQYWDQYLNLISERNKPWVKDAAVLVVVLSKKVQKYKGEQRAVPTHSFDTGSAFMAMALEGTARGLVVHATGGFDREKVAKTIGLKSDDYNIEVILAIGNRAYKAKPETITQRHALDKLLSRGVFVEKIE